MDEEKLLEIEKTAKSYPTVPSDVVLRLVTEYRRAADRTDLWCRMAWNDGVLTTRERVSRELMPKYGNVLGHDVWAVEVTDPYPPLKRKGE